MAVEVTHVPCATARERPRPLNSFASATSANCPMSFLFLVYSLNQGGFGNAAPILPIQQRDGGSCGDSNSDRTIWNIIWSCLSTIFLCTWVAIHPNITFRPETRGMDWREKWLREPLRRFSNDKLPLVLLALIFPEWILAWSVRQWIMAGNIRKRGGTRAHGFFVIMGGFHLYQRASLTSNEDDGSTFRGIGRTFEGNEEPHTPLRNPRDDEIPVHPLGIEDLPEDITIPTEEEIKDRGKSDKLAKVIVLVQTSWFVIQCIARGIKHLHLTELEIVTLAYTMMNFAIYVFWWDKPRDVGCPIRVYNKKSGAREEELANPSPDILSKIGLYVLGTEHEIVRLSKVCAVPMFWSGLSDMNEEAATLISMPSNLGPTILGAGFGATHFIAWLYEFPSHAEFMLWRISCIAMVVVPVMSTIGCLGMMGFNKGGGIAFTVFSFLGLMLGWVAVIFGAWLYIFARIATIVIAFTTLRSLPVDAFKVVDWTTFIPHI